MEMGGLSVHVLVSRQKIFTIAIVMYLGLLTFILTNRAK